MRSFNQQGCWGGYLRGLGRGKKRWRSRNGLVLRRGGVLVDEGEKVVDDIVGFREVERWCG